VNLQRRRTAVRFAFPIQPEQNHDNRAPKSLVQGIDFLRKSILCGFGFGYICRDLAVIVLLSMACAAHAQWNPPNPVTGFTQISDGLEARDPAHHVRP